MLEGSLWGWKVSENKERLGKHTQPVWKEEQVCMGWDGELGEHITALLSDSGKSSEFPSSLQTKSTDLIEMGGRFI